MGRSPCCSKEGLNRGTWTAQEDMILSDYIRIHGDGEWKNLPQKAGESQHICINDNVIFIDRLTKRWEFVLQVLSGVERVVDYVGSTIFAPALNGVIFL
jgi:hypothetical protein